MKLSSELFQQLVLQWFDQHGRKHLPWQQQRSAYRVWISEIMLQQTQVTTVVPYFQRFMARFPAVQTLAEAPLDDVLALWAGLGYYSRARNLHRTAQMIMENFAGEFPNNLADLQTLPGIGRSTAGAILAQSMNQRAAILDGNVKRVLARLHAIAGWPGNSDTQKKLWEVAERYTPVDRVADYTQAMMDLGAMICTRSKPKCTACPVEKFCLALHTDSPANFPGKKPKKDLPLRSTRLLILHNDNGDVLIEKRPPVGIWGGLWSLPECSVETDIIEWCKLNLHCEISSWQALPAFRHSFSHFHLDIQPIVAKLYKKSFMIADHATRRWYNLSNADQHGIAAPVRQLLKKFFTNQNQNEF